MIKFYGISKISGKKIIGYPYVDDYGNQFILTEIKRNKDNSYRCIYEPVKNIQITSIGQRIVY